MKLPLLGGTATDRYDDVSSQLTQNWYLHTSQGKQSLFRTPGQTLFKNIGVGPIRGEINYNGTYFVVSGAELYEVAANGDSVLRGTLNTNFGRCSLAHNGANNGKQICIVDGTNGYIYNSEYMTFVQIEQKVSATTDGTTTDHLIDGGYDYATAGVVKGMVVYNTTDSTKATITDVATGDLTVDDDIFVSGEAYEVGSDAFPDGATHVEFFDGFFIVNDPNNSGRWYKSASYDGTDWSSLEFATAERSPDELEGLIASKRLVWLIGKDTAEAWWNTGDGDFPFEPVQGGFSEWGTIAKYSLVQASGLTFWLGNNKDGDRMVVMANGLQVQIVSSPEIAAEIAAMSTVTDCYAFTYQKFQHTFVVFTFPTAQKTLVYDIGEKEWHTWHSKDLGYHRSTGHTFVYNKHLVGDPITGEIYELDWDTNTENGDQITRRRISANFHGEDKDLTYELVELDIKEGVGAITRNINTLLHAGTATSIRPFGPFVLIEQTGFNFVKKSDIQVGDTVVEESSGISSVISYMTPIVIAVDLVSFDLTTPLNFYVQGTRTVHEDPKINLRWRDDNGAWSNWHPRSMGKIGERGKKVRWRRLGTSSSRVFEISVTDPVDAVIMDGFARIKLDSVESHG